MKIPLYQTHWNNVDLVSLAKELGCSTHELPSNKFYEAYYKQINHSQVLLDQKWIDNKGYQTKWLKEQIENYGNKKSSILSVGAGIGVIELPLIKEGCNIHLQEYQDESLKILKASELTTCYSEDLKNIQNIKFDIIVVIGVTYAMNDKELVDFFVSCNRLLTKNGTLIILDTSLSWFEIYSMFRNKKSYEKTQLLWGTKRSISLFKKSAKNFHLIMLDFYDELMNQLSVKKFMGIPFNTIPTWQMMVFKKND